MRAWLNLRYTLPDRIAVFSAGLERLGFEVWPGLTFTPADGDILVTWNRIGQGDRAAAAFESRGLKVVVAENATWGNEFAGDSWYSLARHHHNTAGRFPEGDADRWDELGVELAPWREGGRETIILPQRGIGTPPVAMPAGWAERAQAATGGRIRRHPGRHKAIDLQDDLHDARDVVTWGSGAAIKALMWGIPVRSDMPDWVGQQDNTDAGRLAMFRRLAWAQWRMDEIAEGTALARCLDL